MHRRYDYSGYYRGRASLPPITSNRSGCSSPYSDKRDTMHVLALLLPQCPSSRGKCNGITTYAPSTTHPKHQTAPAPPLNTTALPMLIGHHRQGGGKEVIIGREEGRRGGEGREERASCRGLRMHGGQQDDPGTRLYKLWRQRAVSFLRVPLMWYRTTVITTSSPIVLDLPQYS